jgi:hypothetical protein
MTELLGNTPPEDADRDCIHANEELLPGSHVDADGRTTGKLVGVADPFYKAIIKPGDRFWLCLYPGSVTNMRHAWESLDFPGDYVSPTARASAEAWMRQYVKANCPYDCDEIDGGYQNFMDRITREGYVFYNGSDLHHVGELADADEFFRHLGAILGRKVDPASLSYSCSC